MLTISFIIAILVEIVLPFIAAFWIVRRFKTSWRLVLIGALVFVVSQVVHIPLLGGLSALLNSTGLADLPAGTLVIFNAVILGLLAGLCEETARWFAYKWLKEKGDSWGSAITLGIGHGGVESVVLVGFTVLSNFIMMSLAASGSMEIPGISPEVIDQFFAMPWHMPLTGAVERIMSVILHITLSVMVWWAVSHRSPIWFWGAVLWHAVIDAVLVYLSSTGMQAWPLEGVMFIATLLNIGGLYWLWKNKVQALPQPEVEIIEPVE